MILVARRTTRSRRHEKARDLFENGKLDAIFPVSSRRHFADMMYQFEFRPYQRRFRQPLQTHHGLWGDRSGILLRLQNAAGHTGYGEIAPLEWFGTESLETALAFCRSLPSVLDEATLLSVPAKLPASQFGFEAVWEILQPGQPEHTALSFVPRLAHLLPTGAAALQVWRSPYASGIRTFKWKIGVAPLQEELENFKSLTAQFPADVQVRLDANGGLSREQACRWLEACEAEPRVEFLEQPLPPPQFETLQQLAQQYGVAIALDESVARLQDLERCYESGWRGIFVVKAAIAGSPRRLRQFCQRQGVDVVWSSVFETAIARQYIEQRLIAALQTRCQRALGWGGSHWFAESRLEQGTGEQLWQRL